MLNILTKNKGEAAVQQRPSGYDYKSYTMTIKDRAIAFFIGFAIAVVILHIFFGNIIVDVIIGTVAGIIAQKIYRNMMVERIKKQLLLQFRDLLDSLNSSVSAGKVITAAFEDAEKDLVMQYGAESHICKEVEKINRGMMNGINPEVLLMDFGERSGIEDIVSFANVFNVSNGRGGEIRAVLNETKSILCDKIDIEQEIATSLSAAKGELNIIIIMPLLIVPLMSSFTQESDNPVLNIGIKIFGLAMFIIAYIIGRKITNIKV